MNKAILGYRASGNLGDAVQSYAMLELLGPDPSVTVVDRDSISAFEPAEQTVLLLNCWLIHRPECFALSRNVTPAMIGVHTSPNNSPYTRYPPFLDVLRGCPSVQEVFQRSAPVGARDLYTLGALQEIGIESYFAGCPTLTLRRKGLAPDGSIVAVDVPESVCRTLQRRLGRPIVRLTNRSEASWMSASALREHVEPYLNRLERAELVITTRLHAALPAQALGVHTIFAPGDPSDPRFSGLADFLPVVLPLSEVAASPLSMFVPDHWSPAHDLSEQAETIRAAVKVAVDPSREPERADQIDPQRLLLELERAALVYDRVHVWDRVRAMRETRSWRYTSPFRRINRARR